MNILTIAQFAHMICSTIMVQSYNITEQVQQIVDLDRYVQQSTQITNIETKLFDIRDVAKGRHVPIKLGNTYTYAVCIDF